MRPKLELLDKPLIERILDEAFQLIEDPGVRVAPYVEDLLRAAGITVKDGVAHIPESSPAACSNSFRADFASTTATANPPCTMAETRSTSIPARPA